MIRAAALSLLLLIPSAATAVPLESVNADDTAVCAAGRGPAIRATILGMKDRTGRVKLELYPGNGDDFLKDDRDLVKEGKFFRRVWSTPAASGAVNLCIKAPAPGRYALLFTHDRDGKNKFNFWKDGAGFPGTGKLGRSRPKVSQAMITVGNGITRVNITAQYLRGVSGFAPLAD